MSDLYQQVSRAMLTATDDQARAAAASLGWHEDDPRGLAQRQYPHADASDPAIQALALRQAAKYYLSRLYDTEMNRVYYGAGTVCRQRGTTPGSRERAAEDAVCERILAALRAAGVPDAPPPTSLESAFAACGGSVNGL